MLLVGERVAAVLQNCALSLRVSLDGCDALCRCAPWLGMTEQRVRTVWRDAGVVHSTCGVTLDG